MSSTKPVYLLVGAPGSGKTWVCEQIKSKFNVLENDAYIGQNYPNAIIKQAAFSSKPILAEAPFSMSQLIEPITSAGLKIVPVFIIEDAETHTARYEARSGRAMPKGHLTRTKTYLDRAVAGGHFYGTSEQVLAHLKQVA